MDSFLRVAGALAAPTVMVAGTAPFYWSNVPESVRAGGVCLTAIGLVLADLKSGRRLGFTDAALAAVRKIPGFEKADEGTLLGVLTMGASGFLGVPATIDMVQSGQFMPHGINTLYNGIAYPLGACFAFQTTRKRLEALVGTERRFSYTDEAGNPCQSEPINPARLWQQVAYLAGAAGITGYGAALGVADIQFTGLMFAAACGISIAELTKDPAAQIVGAKAAKAAKWLEQAIAEDPNASPETARAHLEALAAQMKEAHEQLMTGKGPLKSDQVKDMGMRVMAAMSRMVAQHVGRPAIVKTPPPPGG